MGVMLSSNADTVPPSITTLINRHYGYVDSGESDHESSEQQLDMPLWFVGKLSAKEVCKEDIVLACFQYGVISSQFAGAISTSSARHTPLGVRGLT